MLSATNSRIQREDIFSCVSVITVDTTARCLFLFTLERLEATEASSKKGEGGREKEKYAKIRKNTEN